TLSPFPYTTLFRSKFILKYRLNRRIRNRTYGGVRGMESTSTFFSTRLQITDWDKWDGTVTDNYLKSVQKEISHSVQESVKRELDEIELFVSQPQANNTITYGAFASWHVTVRGKSTSKPMQLYYITLEKEDDEWVVSDMVTPNHQNMEGEGKEEK